MCDLTHSYVWHDSFICVTWLSTWNTLDLERLGKLKNILCVSAACQHDAFICVTWLIHTCEIVQYAEDVGFGETRRNQRTCCACLPCAADVAADAGVCYRCRSRVAVCCSLLQCVVGCYSVLQCAAVCCSVLQHVAACCSVLHCVALCCSILFQVISLISKNICRNTTRHVVCAWRLPQPATISQNAIHHWIDHMQWLQSWFLRNYVTHCARLSRAAAACACHPTPPRAAIAAAPLQQEILVLLSYGFLVSAESTNLQICLPETTWILGFLGVLTARPRVCCRRWVPLARVYLYSSTEYRSSSLLI